MGQKGVLMQIVEQVQSQLGYAPDTALTALISESLGVTPEIAAYLIYFLVTSGKLKYDMENLSSDIDKDICFLIGSNTDEELDKADQILKERMEKIIAREKERPEPEEQNAKLNEDLSEIERKFELDLDIDPKKSSIH